VFAYIQKVVYTLSSFGGVSLFHKYSLHHFLNTGKKNLRRSVLKQGETMLKAALDLQALDISVIPIRPRDKRPLVKWEEFQKRIATPEEIESWFLKWPDANLAIVTGPISNLVVVDIDTPKGFLEIESYIPSSIECPTVHTPRGGAHLYFRAEAGMTNDTGTIPGCDLRAEGGFVVCPPSVGKDGVYTWDPGTYIKECEPPPLPREYVSRMSVKGGGQEVDKVVDIGGQDGGKNGVVDKWWTSGGQVVDNDNTSEDKEKTDSVANVALVAPYTNYISLYNTSVNIEQGKRDVGLYDMAYKMIRAGIPPDEVRLNVFRVASSCKPPFPVDLAAEKIESAIKQAMKRGTMPKTENGVLGQVREWVLNNPEQEMRPSTVAKMFHEPGMSSEDKRRLVQNISKTMQRMAESGLIYRVGDSYFKNEVLERLNVLDARTTPLEMKYPLGLEYWVRTFPRSIIVIAGVSNAGKTAFAMDLAHRNLQTFGGKTSYVTSEMGADQMAYRLSNWMSIEQWATKMDIFFGNKQYHRYIQPNGLTIIDYLEIYDNFYTVGQEIQEIHERLEKGICLVCLQKKLGARYGRGAEFGLEKPQVYLSMDREKVTIEKAKSWGTGKNPNGMECGFTLTGGWKFHKSFDWRDPEDKPKKQFKGTYNPE
jgi:hypothetical protein